MGRLKIRTGPATILTPTHDWGDDTLNSAAVCTSGSRSDEPKNRQIMVVGTDAQMGNEENVWRLVRRRKKGRDRWGQLLSDDAGVYRLIQ